MDIYIEENIIKSIVILLPMICIFLVSCATNDSQTREVPKEFFVTHITENDVKQFSYSLEVSASQRNRRAMGSGRMRGGNMGGRMGGSRGMRANTAEREKMIAMRKEKVLGRLTERLEQKLAQVGYCRDTYIEVDTHIGAGNARIKGKCTDKATSQDKLKFING